MTWFHELVRKAMAGRDLNARACMVPGASALALKLALPVQECARAILAHGPEEAERFAVFALENGLSLDTVSDLASSLRRYRKTENPAAP